MQKKQLLHVLLVIMCFRRGGDRNKRIVNLNENSYILDHHKVLCGYNFRLIFFQATFTQNDL